MIGRPVLGENPWSCENPPASEPFTAVYPKTGPTSRREKSVDAVQHGFRHDLKIPILTWQGCPPDQQGVALVWSKPLHSGVVKYHDKLLKWVLADCIISVSGVVRSRTTPLLPKYKDKELRLLGHDVHNRVF